MADLLSVAPVHPDYHFCDPFYSSGVYAQVEAADCIAAETQMARGSVPVTWSPSMLDEENINIFEIPKLYIAGSCEIKIESVHPRLHEDETSYVVAPDEFREMAGWVIRSCVQGSPSAGGFVTKNVSNVIDYLATSDGNLSPQAYPRSATFFTVSVTGFTLNDQYLPGHHDPTVGGAIFDGLYARLISLTFGDARWEVSANIAEHIGRAWALMQRSENGGFPWYGTYSRSPPKETTTYQCDSTLGNPRHVDCSQLQYSQLRTSSDSITLQAGEAKFLHAGTCSIGISASAPLMLTWDQIKAALNSLIEICVNNPISKSVGGRAYFGHNAGTLFDVSGQRPKKRNMALNALPSHANVTLFQQYEIYPSFPEATVEIQSCTWQTILKGGEVRSCRSEHHHQMQFQNADDKQSGTNCTTNSDCGSNGDFMCTLDDGISLDQSGPATFSCVSVLDATTALGTGAAEIPQCHGECLLGINGTNETLAAAAQSSSAISAPLPSDIVCPCNCTYVSHDCCLSETDLVRAEPSLKLNITVEAPNSTVCCNSKTGLWAKAPVQRDNLVQNTLCPDSVLTETGTGYINF